MRLLRALSFIQLKRNRLSGPRLLPLLLPPAGNADVTSGPVQPVCDREDGGEGARSRAASLNNYRALDSFGPER